MSPVRISAAVDGGVGVGDDFHSLSQDTARCVPMDPHGGTVKSGPDHHEFESQAGLKTIGLGLHVDVVAFDKINVPKTPPRLVYGADSDDVSMTSDITESVANFDITEDPFGDDYDDIVSVAERKGFVFFEGLIDSLCVGMSRTVEQQVFKSDEDPTVVPEQRTREVTPPRSRICEDEMELVCQCEVTTELIIAWGDDGRAMVSAVPEIDIEAQREYDAVPTSKKKSPIGSLLIVKKKNSNNNDDVEPDKPTRKSLKRKPLSPLAFATSDITPVVTDSIQEPNLRTPVDLVSLDSFPSSEQDLIPSVCSTIHSEDTNEYDEPSPDRMSIYRRGPKAPEPTNQFAEERMNPFKRVLSGGYFKRRPFFYPRRTRSSASATSFLQSSISITTIPSSLSASSWRDKRSKRELDLVTSNRIEDDESSL